jgi:hypothetical protein
MEPQIIDYYHEMPHGIHVIDKMNEELSALQKKYGDLEKKINKFKIPYIVVDTVEEYKTYDDIICNHLKHKITDFLRDEETGLFALIRGSGGMPDTLLHAFQISWGKNYRCADRETCKEKIINELDDITNNKNKEWCEVRIDIAFETCLKDKPALRYEAIDEEDLIDDLIHHIYNDENCDYLPTIYIDTCSEHSKYSSPGRHALYDLVSYKCKKCSTLDYGRENLLCWDCE